MSDLLTQLNGGSVPTLDILMLTTFAALHHDGGDDDLVYQDYYHPFLHKECHGSAAGAA